jgi:(p)ppGpp synthase/HD superfamily hydrolase
MKMFERAVALATAAHHGQERKFEGGPYVAHPLKVAELIETIYGGEWSPEDLEIAKSAAVLHDVLEDTTATPQAVLFATNEKVLELVVWLTSTTKPMKGMLGRTARKKIEAARLAGAPAMAKIIKMLDRLDNVTGMVKNPSPSFRKLYADETFELLEGIGDADHELANKLDNAAVMLRDSAL